MNISPRRLLEMRFSLSIEPTHEPTEENVFASVTRTMLRRRKSLPSFRRDGMNYSTLPLPRRERKAASTSDSQLPESGKEQGKNFIAKRYHGTLDRSKSIRKAKVDICFASVLIPISKIYLYG